MLTAELMMISHAVISAFLARMEDPESVLAAYSIAFYLHATLGSPLWACQIISVTYIRDRASFLRMASFSTWVGVPLFVLWLLIGLTPLGDWAYGTVFGAGEEVVRAAKNCTLVFSAMILFVIPRSVVYGLFMVKRRTILITYGSIFRLVALGVLLVFLSGVVQGAEVGAASIVTCVAIETILVTFLARPYFKELTRGARPPGYKDIWRVSWPIMFMLVAESGMVFILNIFLGRLLRPEFALAAFGLLDSLVRVILSPTRNLIPVSQTLINSRGDVRVVVVFSAIVGAVFSAVMLLFFLEPVKDLILGGVMGLTVELADYIAPALVLGAALAMVMTTSALFRGLLINTKRTGFIALSSAGRLLAVVVVGGVAVALDVQNGALIGMFALIAAFTLESVLLGVRLSRTGKIW